MFKYVPTVFCVDCVASLESYQQFKATVQRSFVSLEKLVVDKGLNKNDYLEQLEIYPRGTPDPNRVRASAKPLKVLWKCPGRPRKDGTAAQPRFFKMKAKTPPVYDSDSDKSNSSDENYCRRSDNEEWNPDNKSVNLNKREKKHKTKPLTGSGGVAVKSGKRGRPRKVLLDKIAVKKPEKTHNGILETDKPTEQLNGNHIKAHLFGKRPRGRPPKAGDAENPITVRKNVLQKSFLNESNIPNDEAPRLIVNSSSSTSSSSSKKRRGRPKKTALSTNALKIVVTNNNKKLKKCTKPSITIKSILKKKRGRPKKNDLPHLGMAKAKSSEMLLNRKRKHSQLEKSVGWATETEEEIKIKEESDSESIMTTPPSMESRPKNYKSFILAS